MTEVKINKMERYTSKLNLKESKEGTEIYKMLGNLINYSKKADLSVISNQEKSNIKDRIKELSKLV